MSTTDELSEARRRFPVGDRVHGRVSALPWGPGRTGLFVDLGAEPDGFVDVILLPEEARLWPSVGRDGFFEVLIHWPGQIRLFPSDAGMRSQRCRVSKWSGADWEAMTRRHPVGMTETGTVTDVFTSYRTYGVQFDDLLVAGRI
jgi:hypothetical protein